MLTLEKWLSVDSYWLWWLYMAILGMTYPNWECLNMFEHFCNNLQTAKEIYSSIVQQRGFTWTNINRAKQCRHISGPSTKGCLERFGRANATEFLPRWRLWRAHGGLAAEPDQATQRGEMPRCCAQGKGNVSWIRSCMWSDLVECKMICLHVYKTMLNMIKYGIFEIKCCNMLHLFVNYQQSFRCWPVPFQIHRRSSFNVEPLF